MIDNKIKQKVAVAELRGGDTVEVNGILYTVSGKDLKHGFTGYTYKGDPHYKGITKVTFKVPTANGFRYQ